MAKNDGKYLENKLAEALAAWCETNKGYFYRFYDSKSARNLLPNQPGDFFWLTPGQAVLMECKSTDACADFLSLLEPKQVAKHRLWLRAGHPTVFLFYDQSVDTFDFYWGEQVVVAYLGKKLRLAPVARGTLRQRNELPDAVALLSASLTAWAA